MVYPTPELPRSKLAPMMSRRYPRTLLIVAALSAISLAAQTAPKITTPKEQLGFNIGDDYMVANYTELEAYWKKLATESDRMKLESIGKTEEGRSEEHTSELQSLRHLVCRLLLEKKII